mgnify:CR=1 FL=1
MGITTTLNLQIEIIHLPGACVCRPVIKGDYLYAAVLRSPALSNADSGFVTILNKENKVVSNLGGSEPVYKKDKLNLKFSIRLSIIF